MSAESLHDLFVEELKDAYDAEKQLLKALRQMSRAATHPDLKAAFDSHHEETTGQVEILEEVFGMLELKPRGKHCPGIAGIIEEGKEAIEENEKSPLLDAALVGGGRRSEHYEIAAYSTLIAMANELGYEDAADRLQQILDQEVACDEKLEELGGLLLPLANVASEEDDEDDSDDDEEDDSESDDDESESMDDEDSGNAAASTRGAKTGARKSAAKKSSAKKTPAKKSAAKKSSAKKSARKR